MKITKIPKLPNNLKELQCCNNELTELPNLIVKYYEKFFDLDFSKLKRL